MLEKLAHNAFFQEEFQIRLQNTIAGQKNRVQLYGYKKVVHK
jgi:hypothetical protein